MHTSRRVGTGRAAPLLERLAAAEHAELGPALEHIAIELRDHLGVDLVAVEAAGGVGEGGPARGYGVGPSPRARSLGALLPRERTDPIGLAALAVRRGEAVLSARLGPAEEGPETGTRGEAGGRWEAARALLEDASAVAIPLLADGRSVGAVTLVGLDEPVGDPHREELELLAPKVAAVLRVRRMAAQARRATELLEGVIAATDRGVLFSDVEGRLALCNATASRLMGIDFAALVGQPMTELLGERVKWRMKNPAEYEARLARLHGDPERRDQLEVETVDDRTVEHFSAPVRDGDGTLLGRVDILSDVTDVKAALGAAQRLAEERATLLEREERRAREEMQLARAAHMMASALTRADVHEQLLEQATELVSADKCAVLALDRRGDVFPAATRGFSDETVAHMGFEFGEGVVGRVLATRRPFICNDTERDARVSRRITRPEGIRSFMHVPLVVGERVYGLLSVNSAAPRAFGERELRVITELTRHAAVALQNALQFDQERHIAETLQQALLAEELPKVPGLDMAALYQAAAGSGVGGDLYNVWRLPHGEVGVLVGDVSGKGVEAAGVTAMVRYMTEALSQHQRSPGGLLTELNELLCPRLADGSLVTALIAVLHPAADTLRWSSAGHPPPLVVDAAGGSRWLEDPGPPCGVFHGVGYADHVEPFRRGDLLFAYTDGLIEASRGGRQFGEENLRSALLEALGQPPRALARAVYAAARAWSDGRIADDVAIAVVSRTD
jgi:sigma-B regulation protein RsbU (phosphoserine phosphatase)